MKASFFLLFASFLLQSLHADSEGEEHSSILLRSVVLLDEEGTKPLPEPLQNAFFEEGPRFITLGLIEELKQRITRYYQAQKKSLVYVTVPEQEVTAGALSFEVHQAKVGKISYNNTRWFSPKKIQKAIPLAAGEVLDQEKLLNDTAWANRNPFHATEITFVPGTNQGTTDVEFTTRERAPFRFYVGADNTGVKETDPVRLFAGALWGNAFGVGDLLTVQCTSSPDFHKFTSYFAKYDCFLPWKHILSLAGGYARIHPDIPHFRSEGQDAQASLYYTIPFLPLYTSFQHELSVGVNYKSLNSNLFFQDVIPVVAKTAQITDIKAIYQLEDVLSRHKLSFKAELCCSPCGWLPDQTEARYHALRPGAPTKFFYAKGMLSDHYQATPAFSLFCSLRGQGASAPLLPSEQFGLGGYDTVRGYKEHAFNADNAFCANVEVEHCTRLRRQGNELSLLAFLDYGCGHNRKAESGLPATQHLLGVGPGARLRIGSWLMLRAEYGFQLHNIFQDDHFGRFHLRAVLSY